MKRGPRIVTVANLIAALAIVGVPVPLRAVDEDTSPIGARDPDFAAGRTALEGEQWEEAARCFARVALREPDNADARNLLGFSYRQGGQTRSGVGAVQACIDD
jgi:hypothetical protein